MAAPSSKHQDFYHILTTAPPLTARAHCLDLVKLSTARSEFTAMDKASIIRHSNSPWASPLHFVLKPDGTWCPTRDYCHLSLATTPDCYPLPNILDFTSNLAGTCFFTKLDLVKGYFQVPMSPLWPLACHLMSAMQPSLSSA